MNAFTSLHAVLRAHLQGDAAALDAALEQVSARDLCAHATRHKCAALLFEAAMSARARSTQARTIIQSLKSQMATFTLDAQMTREQLGGIVTSLRAANVPFALLKSAGRLYAGDVLAERTQTFDIDVLVPRSASAPCIEALRGAGYDYEYERHAAGYMKYHHHLAPLRHPAFRKALEVHVALTPPESFSLRSDWGAMEPDMEWIDGTAGQARRLNATGRAWHMALHGATLYRLGDAVQIAIEALRSDRTIVRTLFERTLGEHTSRIPLQAVLCVAADLAGVTVPQADDARKYAGWAFVREDLPRVLRNRAQLIDAWYANGCSARGPATRLAFPQTYSHNGEGIPFPRRARAIAGLAFAAAAIAMNAPLRAQRP